VWEELIEGNKRLVEIHGEFQKHNFIYHSSLKNYKRGVFYLYNKETPKKDYPSSTKLSINNIVIIYDL